MTRRFLSWLLDMSLLRIVLLVFAIEFGTAHFWGHWALSGLSVGAFVHDSGRQPEVVQVTRLDLFLFLGFGLSCGLVGWAARDLIDWVRG